MKSIIIATLGIIALGLSSCNVEKEMEKISIGGIEEVRTRGVSLNRAGIDVYVGVENLSGRKLEVKAASADIFLRGKKVLAVKLNEGVKVGRRTAEVVRLPFTLEFSGMFGALGAVPMLISGMEQATADVDITVRAGMIKKRYRQNGIPLAALSDLGVDVEEMLGNFKFK